MSRPKKIAIIVAGIFLALTLFCITILPLIVRSKAASAISEATGRTARIEKVAINPFTLTVTVTGLAIEGKKGGAFLSVARIRASLGLASIYRRALILSELSLETPSVAVTRLAPNSYDFTDIIERQKAKPKKEAKGEFHFSVNNVAVANGSIDFDDRAVTGGRKHTIRNLKIAVPFISNIPYLVERYTDPHISALVNGAPFTFNGKVKPLSKSLETSVRIDLKQLSLPRYLAYAPVPPPVDLTSGNLTMDTVVTYRVSSEKQPELGVKGLIRLDGTVVSMKNGQQLLKLPSLRVSASETEVFARRFLFDNITVDGMELFVDRDAKGEWMYSRLLPKTADKGQKPAADDEQKPKTGRDTGEPLVQVASFAFNSGAVHFSDAKPTGGFRGEIGQIDARAANFTTAPGKKGTYELSLLLDNEATFNADGEFSLTPLTATVSSELTGLRLQRGWPYLSRILTSPVKGTIDISSEASYSKENGLLVEQGHFLAKGLSARYGDREGIDLERFEVTGSGYNQKENSIQAAEIMFSRGKVSLSREADGSISLLSLLKKPGASSPQPQAPALPKPSLAKKSGPKGQNVSKPFSFRFKKVQIDGLATRFTDKTRPEKPSFTLRNTSLSLADLNGPRFTPAALRFSSTFNGGTPLKAAGKITPHPFHYKGSVTVGRLPLRNFEAYFPANVNVFIVGGTTDAKMNLDIAMKNGKPAGSFRGSAGIRGFHAIDTVAEEDLLKWESLQLDDIQGTLEPFSLALREIALNGVYSRITIRKDGTLNLQNLVEREKTGTGERGQEGMQEGGKSVPAPPATASAPPPSEPRSQAAAQPSVPSSSAMAPGKKIEVGAVTIQEGTLSFTDNHLPQHFATTFHNLGGRVSGLSSEESKYADVDLRGNLENHSPLQITGQINPLRDDLFVDLKVSFRDIDLSPATPYSGTYLGYTVEKGKLYLDLKYHIEKKLLNSENRVFIDQFTFGERVESPKATKLPVKLGLALLKDRKGEIHLDMPVTGRTDDPQFSLWGVVWQVVKNLMVKAVTSPFSLLSTMFGGQDFSAIQFDHGASAITPQEEQKLTNLARALLDRPALKVELKGYVDREKDAEAYRRVLLDRKVRNEKLLALTREGSLKEGETAETIQVSREEYPNYLAAVYKKEKFPKPRNILGLVKGLPPDEMRKLIIANTVIGEAEFQTLARERVAAVLNRLVKKGNVPAERVFQKNDDVFRAPDKDSVSRSRVELNAIAQ